MSTLKPADIKTEVMMILRNSPFDWHTPHAIWEEIKRLAPETAEEIIAKVATYKDPERNNAVWFITNTFSHLDETEFERSNVKEHPEMKAPGVWEIVRKVE